MKILIAAKHPPNGKMPIGGVQSWSATVAEALSDMGHHVECWGPEFGAITHHFDAGIFANWRYTQAAAKNCGKVLRISHGIIPDEAIGDAFTSEEVRHKWGGSGPIIRQPINLDFWTPMGRRRRYLVRFSYRSGLDYLSSIARQMNLAYVHLKNSDEPTVREFLRQAACVVATGRAACEAMACGAPVVIADHREYQGPLLDCDTVGAMERNYSGRGGTIATEPAIRQAINDAINRGSLRQHAERFHNSQHIAEQILCLLS